MIGVEGSGNYGARLTRHLLESGEDVHEVPAFLSHRERKKTPARGKSDVQDALAIARVTARGDGLSAPQRTEVYHDLKLLPWKPRRAGPNVTGSTEEATVSSTTRST